MKSRLAFVGVAAMTAILAACGGGGGGGGSSLPTTGSTTTPSPSPSPSPSPNFLAQGNSFAFNGTITETDTYTYPSPSPFPSTSSVANVTQQIVIGASPFPGVTASDFHSVETDAFALSNVVTTTDAWYGIQAAASSSLPLNVVELGANATDNASPSNTLNTVYAVPQIIDEEPETNGTAWTNSPTATQTGSYTDGSTVSRTINGDGSYTETQTQALGQLKYLLTTHADGSGTYGGSALSAIGVQSYMVAAPVSSAITVSILLAPSTPIPSPTPFVIATPAAWFTPIPGGSAPLYGETDTLSTGIAYPSQCAVPATFGQSGGHIAQVIDRIDPMIGTTEHETVDTYTAQFDGPVCVILNDRLVSHYDYLLDAAPKVVDFSGQDEHVHTTSEILTLKSVTFAPPPSSSSTTFASSRRAAISAVARTIPPAAVAVARAHFALAIENTKHKIFKATMKAFQQRAGLHVVEVQK